MLKGLNLAAFHPDPVSSIPRLLPIESRLMPPLVVLINTLSRSNVLPVDIGQPVNQ